MYNPNHLCVVYASDDNYAPFMGVSMQSLFEHNQEVEQITVYLLDYGVSAENRERLARTAQAYQRTLIFQLVDDCIAQLDLHMGARKISIVSYARLFMCSVIPDTFDRVIYLDCDVIVNDSLLPMWQTELGNALIAGVQDTVDNYYFKAIDLAPDVRYVNAGVLLIHLKAWREEDLQTKFMAYIREKGGNVQHHDQGVINHTCGARRVILSLRYNVTSNTFSFSVKQSRRMFDMSGAVYYTQAEVEEARKSPAIIHFTTGVLGRPWEEGCEHPMRALYSDALAASQWRGKPLQPQKQDLMTKVASFVCNHISTRLFVELFRLLSKRYYQ